MYREFQSFHKLPLNGLHAKPLIRSICIDSPKPTGYSPVVAGGCTAAVAGLSVTYCIHHHVHCSSEQRDLLFILFLLPIQVFYWVGAVSGSALSAYLSNTWGQAVGVDPWVGFLGGVLMLFGARLASGCTRYSRYSMRVFC